VKTKTTAVRSAKTGPNEIDTTIPRQGSPGSIKFDQFSGIKANYGGHAIVFDAQLAENISCVPLREGRSNCSFNFANGAWCYIDLDGKKEIESLTCEGLRVSITDRVIWLSASRGWSKVKGQTKRNRSVDAPGRKTS
jgi:hypothetical protein